VSQNENFTGISVKQVYYGYIMGIQVYYGRFCKYASVTYIVQFQNGGCVMSGQIIFSYSTIGSVLFDVPR
jgi:uncharacterized membrane protein